MLSATSHIGLDQMLEHVQIPIPTDFSVPENAVTVFTNFESHSWETTNKICFNATRVSKTGLNSDFRARNW